MYYPFVEIDTLQKNSVVMPVSKISFIRRERFRHDMGMRLAGLTPKSKHAPNKFFIFEIPPFHAAVTCWQVFVVR
jgi:hypothetical protein